ncbi:hypothetical protein ACFE04_000295 [Oxalis oulophora]
MCGGPERSKSSSSSSEQTVVEPNNSTPDNMSLTEDDLFSTLLDLASDNDVEGFKKCIDKDTSAVDTIGLWYIRQKGCKQVVAEQRTPLMVAAMFGSLDVMKLILSCSYEDVNRVCGSDKSTALHCAASGGSENALEAVKLLLAAGANVSCVDGDNRGPADVMVVHRKLQNVRAAFEDLLRSDVADGFVTETNLKVVIAKSNSSSPVSSPTISNYTDVLPVSSVSEKKEYPVDPSLPDIKNSIYTTDEFRMFSFKVRPCSRAYSHDWTECPFVHPGENARRRDPRKFHYSCVPCPDFRKGACRRGDMCEYAHGVFECWLHPAQYRTRLCKDGTSCNRRVCFFAHLPEELRPLYVSTGSAVPSPRSSPSVMDMAAALNMLPGSPSSVSAMSGSPFNQQPMSPSNGNLSSPAWPQPNVPTLHLPGSNFQSSRLRSSLSARDILPEDFDMLPDFDARQNIINDLTCLSQSPGRMSPRSVDPISPMGVRLSAFGQREKLRSLSSRELGSNVGQMVGSPVSSPYPTWGSPTGKADWSHNGDEMGHIRNRSSFEPANNNVEEPDLSWVQSLVKESPPEMMKGKLAGSVSGGGLPPVEGLNSNSQNDSVDNSVIGAWLEQMQLDQLVV